MPTLHNNIDHLNIPELFYGTAWKEEKTANLVEQALELGFRAIDTACQPKHYKEPLVGEGIQRAYAKGLKRSDLFIQTKFTPLSGQDPQNIPYDSSKDICSQIQESVETSKINLKTDYLDSLLLHSPLESLEKTLTAWQVLEKFVQRGEIKKIGISNCYDPIFLKSLYQQAQIKPAIIQNRFYPVTQYDTEIRTFCLNNDIYYQCFWTINANPHILESRVIKELATQKEKKPVQIFFRYLNHMQIHPIMGTTNKEHMQEGLNLFSFSLTEVECELISKIKGFL